MQGKRDGTKALGATIERRSAKAEPEPLQLTFRSKDLMLPIQPGQAERRRAQGPIVFA